MDATVNSKGRHIDAKLARLVPKEDATGSWVYTSQYDPLREKEALVSVRQIPPNRRSVTGLLPSRKNGGMVPFESALERSRHHLGIRRRCPHLRGSARGAALQARR